MAVQSLLNPAQVYVDTYKEVQPKVLPFATRNRPKLVDFSLSFMSKLLDAVEDYSSESFDKDFKAWRNVQYKTWRQNGLEIVPGQPVLNYEYVSELAVLKLRFVLSELQKLTMYGKYDSDAALEFVYTHRMLFVSTNEAMGRTYSKTKLLNVKACDAYLIQYELLNLWVAANHIMYAKSYVHFCELNGETSVDFLQTSKLIEELDKQLEIGMPSLVEPAPFEVDLSLTLGQKLIALCRQREFKPLNISQQVTHAWAKYMGFKSSLVSELNCTFGDFSDIVLEQFGEVYAIKHALYLLVELGGLYRDFRNFRLTSGGVKTTIMEYTTTRFTNLIEKYALGEGNVSILRAKNVSLSSSDESSQSYIHFEYTSVQQVEEAILKANRREQFDMAATLQTLLAKALQ